MILTIFVEALSGATCRNHHDGVVFDVDHVVFSNLAGRPAFPRFGDGTFETRVLSAIANRTGQIAEVPPRDEPAGHPERLRVNDLVAGGKLRQGLAMGTTVGQLAS